MPYVTISATQGLSAGQKKQLLEGASDAVVQSTGASLASVRVMLHELADGHYLNAGRFGTPSLMFVVELVEGRSEEQKAALILSLHKVGVQAGSVPENEIRVRLIDFPKSNMGMAGGVSAKALAG